MTEYRPLSRAAPEPGSHQTRCRCSEIRGLHRQYVTGSRWRRPIRAQYPGCRPMRAQHPGHVAAVSQSERCNSKLSFLRPRAEQLLRAHVWRRTEDICYSRHRKIFTEKYRGKQWLKQTTQTWWWRRSSARIFPSCRRLRRKRISRTVIRIIRIRRVPARWRGGCLEVTEVRDHHTEEAGVSHSPASTSSSPRRVSWARGGLWGNTTASSRPRDSGRRSAPSDAASRTSRRPPVT